MSVPNLQKLKALDVNRLFEFLKEKGVPDIAQFLKDGDIDGESLCDLVWSDLTANNFKLKQLVSFRKICRSEWGVVFEGSGIGSNAHSRSMIDCQNPSSVDTHMKEGLSQNIESPRNHHSIELDERAETAGPDKKRGRTETELNLLEDEERAKVLSPCRKRKNVISKELQSEKTKKLRISSKITDGIPSTDKKGIDLKSHTTMRVQNKRPRLRIRQSESEPPHKHNSNSKHKSLNKHCLPNSVADIGIRTRSRSRTESGLADTTRIDISVSHTVTPDMLSSPAKAIGVQTRRRARQACQDVSVNVLQSSTHELASKSSTRKDVKSLVGSPRRSLRNQNRERHRTQCRNCPGCTADHIKNMTNAAESEAQQSDDPNTLSFGGDTTDQTSSLDSNTRLYSPSSAASLPSAKSSPTVSPQSEVRIVPPKASKSFAPLSTTTAVFPTTVDPKHLLLMRERVAAHFKAKAKTQDKSYTVPIPTPISTPTFPSFPSDSHHLPVESKMPEIANGVLKASSVSSFSTIPSAFGSPSSTPLNSHNADSTDTFKLLLKPHTSNSHPANSATAKSRKSRQTVITADGKQLPVSIYSTYTADHTIRRSNRKTLAFGYPMPSWRGKEFELSIDILNFALLLKRQCKKNLSNMRSKS